MDTEFDIMTAWLEVQVEWEELEKEWFNELRGIKDGDRYGQTPQNATETENNILRGQGGGIL